MIISRIKLRPQSLATNINKSIAVRINRLASTDNEEKIEIPKYIPRGPTDILRALESTISRDPTASHYKYHDDPFLIPMSLIGKRTFALAQEAGRKAAHFVRREHADLFQHKVADPPIELFFPPVIYTEKSDVTLKDLENVIELGHPSDAKLIYNLLKDKGVKVNVELQQSLLELFCFYNSTDPLPDEFIEERWFRQTNKNKEKKRNMWKDGDFAEELFISLENPTSEAYCAIIQGMVKYFQADRAWQLFQEAKEKNIELNTNTYNAIICISNFLKESYELRRVFVLDMLREMKIKQLKPNLGTLEATLEAFVMMGNSKSTKDGAIKVLAEFRALGIEPSLTAWYSLLSIFLKEGSNPNNVLKTIIDYLEGKDLQIQNIKDTNFFVNAMGICRNLLKDVNLAKRINKLLNHGQNYNLIGDSFKESVYYRNYFVLLCNHQPFEEFMMETYQTLVPHIYIPEIGVMQEILEQTDINCAVEHLPRLWSDLIIFDHANKETIYTTVLNIIVNNDQIVDTELKKKFSEIAWYLFTKSNEESSTERIHTNKVNLSGENLGKIMIILLRDNDFEKASQVMDKLDKGHQTIVGVPKLEALSMFVDHCITEKAPSKAIVCIQFCSDCGFPEAIDLARKLKENLTLDEIYLEKLIKIVGDFI